MKNNSLHQKAIQTILYGHSCAMRLKLQLNSPMADNEYRSASTHDLTKSILHCFSNAISILSNKPIYCDDQSSDFSSTISSPLHPQENPCKKRKIKITDKNEIWSEDSPNSIYYDGFLWIKYGQKHIKKTNQQRSYYKCAYTNDNHCKARKQEQKIKDNPPVYRTTYIGHHICKINHHQDLVLDPIDDKEGTHMIQFEPVLGLEKEINSSGFSLPVKHHEEEGNNTKEYGYRWIDEIQSSPLDCYLPCMSSSGNESSVFNPDDLFVDNLDSLDYYEHFDLGLY